MNDEKMKLMSYLKTQPLFKSFLASEGTVDFRFFSLEQYKQGDTIIDYDDNFSFAFFTALGSVAIECRDKDGKSIPIGELSALELFALISEEAGHLSRLKFVADSPCEIVKISAEGVSYFAENFPTMNKALIKNTLDYLKKIAVVGFLQDYFPYISTKSAVEIDRHSDWVNVRGGETLFYENDFTDSIYYVISGRLKVYKTGSSGNEIPIGDIYVRETVGELGLFTDNNRMATVRAVRDSLLLKIDRVFFEGKRGFSETISKKVFSQLVQRSSNINREHKNKVEKIITITSLGNSKRCEELVKKLLNRLMTLSKTVVLTLERAEKELLLSSTALKGEFWHKSLEHNLSSWLSKYEKSYDFIIFFAENNNQNWNRYCKSHSDEICIVVDAEKSPYDLQDIERDYHPEEFLNQRLRLVFSQKKNSFYTKSVFDWYKLFPRIEMHHFVREESLRLDLFRVVRFISHKALGIVLGGGGVRSMAHLGVLKALEESRIAIDYIGGCSGGARIGFQYALGWSAENCIEDTLKNLAGAKLNYTFPFLSITSGKTYRKSLENTFGDKHIEESLIPYFALSCNMNDASPYIHKKGWAVEAILASSSIPGIMPPVVIDGQILVDGGVLSVLPVELMKQELRGSLVIASDVTMSPRIENVKFSGYGESGLKLLFQSYFRPDLVKIPNMINLLIRAGELASIYHSKITEADKKADIFIKPPVSHFETFDFKSGKKIVDAGYDYATSLLHSTNLAALIPDYNFF